MQYGSTFCQGRRGYSSYPPPPPPPPHTSATTSTTNHYSPNYGYPLFYYPSGAQNYYNNSSPFTNGYQYHSYNAGGNRYDGHGIQKNGDVKIGNGNGNGNAKRRTTIIGGCHGNQGGYQLSGDLFLGDIH